MKNIILISLASLYVYLLTLSSINQVLPDALPYFLLVVNVLAFSFYGLDKLAALRSWRRTPEKHFYILALFGAWPGSVLGQIIFHHKTSKKSFRRCFYIMILVNLLCIIGYLYSIGFTISMTQYVDNVLNVIGLN